MAGACVAEGSQPPTITPAGGHAFLGGSHFSIGHDDTYTKPGLQSVFKQDYPAWDIHGAPPGITPPAPSHLHHEDIRYVTSCETKTNIHITNVSNIQAVKTSLDR